MAQFPCSNCGQRYRGPQRTIYPAIVNFSEAQRARRRLCPNCFEMVQALLRDRFTSGQDLGFNPDCMECASQDTPYSVFVTSYPGGEDREDFYGRLCERHRHAGIELALFGTQSPI
jgi:hypothetical protein